MDVPASAAGGGTGSVLSAPARAGGSRLVVRGRLDAAGAERLRRVVEDALEQSAGGPGPVIRVDLSRSAALGVPVLRALTGAHLRLAGHGGRLLLEQPSAAARRTLRVSGLDRILSVDDAGEAERSAAPALQVRSGQA